jgi:hypothetical protein
MSDAFLTKSLNPIDSSIKTSTVNDSETIKTAAALIDQENNQNTKEPNSHPDDLSSPKKRSAWVSALSTFFLALIPVFKSCPPCPLCMPKYAAILSFLGLPLADYSHYLTPIMFISMLITVISLMVQGYKHYNSRMPAFIALTACLIILISRNYESYYVSYLGMSLLFLSLVFHQMKIKNKKHSCCDHHH